MCQLAEVSRASFYRDWEQAAPQEAEVALRDALQRAAVQYRCYGYRRMQVLIEREGFAVGAKKVRRLMREDNLLAVRKRKFIVTTESDHPLRVYPNLAEHLILSDVQSIMGGGPDLLAPTAGVRISGGGTGRMVTACGGLGAGT